eukprot:5813748-Heterocapsa_arctica.AAC.1
MEAVKQDGEALQYASMELKGDKEMVMEADKSKAKEAEILMKKNNNNDLKEMDKDMVMEAVKQDGEALQQSGRQFEPPMVDT